MIRPQIQMPPPPLATTTATATFGLPVKGEVRNQGEWQIVARLILTVSTVPVLPANVALNARIFASPRPDATPHHLSKSARRIA